MFVFTSYHIHLKPNIPKKFDFGYFQWYVSMTFYINAWHIKIQWASSIKLILKKWMKITFHTKKTRVGHHNVVRWWCCERATQIKTHSNQNWFWRMSFKWHQRDFSFGHFFSLDNFFQNILEIVSIFPSKIVFELRVLTLLIRALDKKHKKQV